MRVIVTGGTGRAGRWTVRELAEAGHEVANVDRTRPAEALPGSFIQIDLTDAGAAGEGVLAVPAGFCLTPGPVEDRMEWQWNRQVDTISRYEAARPG